MNLQEKPTKPKRLLLSLFVLLLSFTLMLGACDAGDDNIGDDNGVGIGEGVGNDDEGDEED